jgi:hypothetical protein
MAKERLDQKQLKELAKTKDPQQLKELSKDQKQLKEVAKYVEEKDMQKVAEAICSHHKTEKASSEGKSGEQVRARCAGMCELSIRHSGEIFALVDCGRGTCPTCPPGLGNLIVRNWCAYHSVSSDKQAIILHLAFGGQVGPFLV